MYSFIDVLFFWINSSLRLHTKKNKTANKALEATLVVALQDEKLLNVKITPMELKAGIDIPLKTV